MPAVLSWLLLCLSLLSLPQPASAVESSLARLCLWLAPERVAEFEEVYREALAPLLKLHGLVPAAAQGWPTADSVFCRLFAFDSPAQIWIAERALQQVVIKGHFLPGKDKSSPTKVSH